MTSCRFWTCLERWSYQTLEWIFSLFLSHSLTHLITLSPIRVLLTHSLPIDNTGLSIRRGNVQNAPTGANHSVRAQLGRDENRSYIGVRKRFFLRELVAVLGTAEAVHFWGPG